MAGLMEATTKHRERHKARYRKARRVTRNLRAALLFVVTVNCTFATAQEDDRGLSLVDIVKSGNVASVIKAIDGGADVNAADKDGLTPLIAAVLADDVAITQVLLDHGADPTAPNKDGKSAVEVATPGSRVMLLRGFPKQVDASQVASQSVSSPESPPELPAPDDSVIHSSQAQASSEPRAVDRLTRLRLIGKPEGVWERGRHISLNAVSAKIRNVGEIPAEQVEVTAHIPGIETILLEGPTRLERNQTEVYSAAPEAVVRSTKDIEIKISCANCRSGR